MSKELLHYHANLFRGWELVRLQYVLEEDALVMHRHRTWAGADQQRIDLAALSGEVRHIWSRQPAFVFSTIILVLALLVLGIDATMHGVGAGGSPINWTLWAPLLAVSVAAWFVRAKTKRRTEWSHLVGHNKGTGLFVLVDPRNRKAHEKFVAAVKDRIRP